jgi:predicted DNA repair protein MutK
VVALGFNYKTLEEIEKIMKDLQSRKIKQSSEKKEKVVVKPLEISKLESTIDGRVSIRFN